MVGKKHQVLTGGPWRASLWEQSHSDGVKVSKSIVQITGIVVHKRTVGNIFLCLTSLAGPKRAVASI